MKDSGIEWIGECPEHWEFVRGRYLFKQRNTKGNLKNLELLSPSQKFGVVPQTLLEELTTQTVVKVKYMVLSLQPLSSHSLLIH